jgi:quinoprotein glucose dehydrogenase
MVRTVRQLVLRIGRRAIGLEIPAAVGVVAIALCGVIRITGSQSPLSGTANGEWRAYHGDLRQHHYSPLDQINTRNFSGLEVAWRFKTDNLGTRPEYKLEGTPLMIKGVVYATAGTRRSVVALDATTGELLWAHGEHEGKRGAVAPRQLSGRGLSYWTDGREERVVYLTPGFRLVALDARTGTLVTSFGKSGLVDLKEHAVFGKGQPIDLETGEIGLHATPAVGKDVILVGSSFKEGHTPKTHNNTKGLVQAFDARTGKYLWTFNTIPKPGEFGNDTWENESWAINGNTGVWNQIAIDDDLGLAYLPVETPTSDFYGGHRPGNNLFAESLVCVDLKTGKRKWHFQLVHHPIWNMDISTGPILEEITVDGRNIKAVSVMGKQGMVYVFDRVTGQPVWPIEERAVPQSDVPGEKTSPTQPFPTRPPAYERNGISQDDLIDFTPELRAEAITLISRYHIGPVYSPNVVSKAEGPLGGFRPSATNVFGGAYDPETHILYAPSSSQPTVVALLPSPSPAFSDIRYVEGSALYGVVYIGGPGEGAGADGTPPPPRPAAAAASAVGSLTPQGLPILKPPYGSITAISMDKGEFVWRVAHGETPDTVRNHPLLKGLNIPRTGQYGAIGVLATKSLVIAGDPQVTTLPGRPRGAMLRAYDKATGKEVGAVWMPAPQSGTPMTYMANGKQYIIVAVSGGNYSGEYIAFSLPRTELPSTP